VLQRYCYRYARAGLAGLIDKRCIRRCTLNGRVDPRYVAAFLEVLNANVGASAGTSTRLKRLVDKTAYPR
jgi:hypothetical protein